MTDTARQNRLVLAIVTALMLLSVILFPVGVAVMWWQRLYPAWVRWSLTGLLGIFVVSLAAPTPEKPAGDQAQPAPPVAAPVEPAPSLDRSGLRIRHGVEDVRRMVPLLGRIEPRVVERNGATDHLWSKVSLRGTPNSVALYDVGSDGTLDYGLLSLVVPGESDPGKDAKAFEALALAARLIEVLGEPEEPADAITTWIVQNARAGSRRFGSVVVETSVVGAGDGGVLLLTIDGGQKPPE